MPPVKLYDITPRMSPKLAVWPGDPPLVRNICSDMERGAATTNSWLKTSVHAGAHADALSHFGIDGATIDEMPLDYYIGSCQVLRPKVERGQRVVPEMLKTPVVAQRVLFATGTYLDFENFNKDFAGLSPELIHMLSERGVKLVGIDTPSVDTFEAPGLPAHAAVLEYKMAILETLDLSDVPEGIYELIALPLRLVGFDASPVRAVLRTLK